MTSTAIRVFLMLVLLVGVTATVTTAAPLEALAVDRQESDEATPKITVTNASISQGGTAVVSITMDRAPTGVSGFNISYKLADPGVAAIANVTAGGSFGLSRNSVSPNADQASIEAVDVQKEVQPGARDIKLASIAVEYTHPGRTAQRMTVITIQDESGNELAPTVQSGQLTVGDVSPRTEEDPTASTESPASSPAPTDGGGGGPGDIRYIVALLVVAVSAGYILNKTVSQSD